MSGSDLESFKKAAALAAVEYVKDGMVVGLGTGSTAKHLIIALGEKVKTGLKIRGVSTSQDTASLAARYGIALNDHEPRWRTSSRCDPCESCSPPSRSTRRRVHLR